MLLSGKMLDRWEELKAEYLLIFQGLKEAHLIRIALAILIVAFSARPDCS